MVRYPLRAIRALGYLKAAFNDAEIYVEDTTCRNMHLFIYQRLLPGNVKLRSINQVGDRARVLAACMADQADDGRRKLYIIDGDFDGLLGRRMPRLKFLYRLRTYDVENLLFSERAVMTVGMSTRTNDEEAVIAREFDFSNWYRRSVRAFLPLFEAYAAVYLVDPRIQTVGYTVHQLCDVAESELVPSSPKIRARIANLLREVRRSGQWAAYLVARKKVHGRVTRARQRERFISGKRYLFPLMAFRMRKVLKATGNDDHLKVQLALHYSAASEPELARAFRML